MAKKIKTGDYVEVLEGAGNGGVEDGEQGFVVNGNNQNHLGIIFPACADVDWRGERDLFWFAMAEEVKLVYRL